MAAPFACQYRSVVMDASRIDAAAQGLVAARRSQTLFATSGKLAGLEDAYAVQDRVAAACGPITGWKVGASAPQDEPRCAPLLAGGVLMGPARMGSRGVHMLGVESEIAFRIGRDIPAGTPVLGRDAVMDAVVSANVAIEVCDTRLVDWRAVDEAWRIADNQSNRALVVGDAFGGWRTVDWGKQGVSITADDAMLSEGVGTLQSGDPVRVLTWLVNHCIARRGGIKAGAWVTTGSWTGMLFVRPGAHVRVAFAGLGGAAVDFEA